MKFKYLVTGTGRCGTVYMARFLTSLGINCGHEAIFDHQGLPVAIQRLNGQEEKIQTSRCSRWNHVTKEDSDGWFVPLNIQAESSYMAAPYLDEPVLDGVKIIHLVRNPLEVLSSWVLDVRFFDPETTSIEHFRNFIYSHIPIIKEEKTEIEKACRYLIEWNKLIEKTKRDKILVQIEDFPYVDLLNFLDDEIDISKIKELKNKRINSWKKRRHDLMLSDIPNGQTKEDFVKQMSKYGYFKGLCLLC